MSDPQTVLYTYGPRMAFEVFNAECTTDREQSLMRRGIGRVALIVHRIDPGPRQTVIFHTETSEN